MGSDKASLDVFGERASDRIVRLLRSLDLMTTVLGPSGQPDPTPGAGPLFAIADFKPSAEWVFVASCDMPLFDPRVVSLCMDSRAAADAVLPIIDQRIQPLCGIYRATAFAIAARLVENGERRIMAWVENLEVMLIGEAEFLRDGVSIDSVRGANSPEEWRALIETARSRRQEREST